jgi:bacillithiol biosynthesis deacetylase BshB1
LSDRLDVLAIGAHPDDVELGCGGTVALLASQERRVGILHLTSGEMGTRGTPAERREEAKRAGRVLGVDTVIFLDCGDGGLRTGEPEQHALTEVLRRYRPELVFGPSPRDRHPDHERAYRLVHEACFYSGLQRRFEGEPHRPAAVYSYMQNDSFEPAFIVDVTTSWKTKLASLDEYRSQLHQPGEQRDEPGTKVSSAAFRDAVVGRARHFGMLIGAEFGEPFLSRLPLAVGDPWSLRPRRLR